MSEQSLFMRNRGLLVNLPIATTRHFQPLASCDNLLPAAETTAVASP